MKRIGIYVLMFVALLAMVMPLLPFQDDWTYLTAPNPGFVWRDLLPGAAFWRPFDALWGGILGCAPWLFPWANRIAIVLGHVLCVYLVARIVDELCDDKRGKSAAKWMFVCAAVILAFAAPHCLFRNHHPAEMHFYPVVLGGAFALALAPMDKVRRVPFCASVVAMSIVFAMGWYDKMSTMYVTSGRAKELMAEIRDKVSDFNAPMEYKVKAVTGLRPYSVYSQSPAWCLDHGGALRCLNGWRESKVKIVEE